MPDYRPGLGDDCGRYVRRENGWLEYRLAPGHTAEIVNVEVSNLHRREGVGRSLVEGLLGEVSGVARQVYAFTRADNRIAREWYEALGFRLLADVPGFYPGGGGAALYAIGVPE